jgi:CubicO group peptidase (beta-lactamase class C family)
MRPRLPAVTVLLLAASGLAAGAAASHPAPRVLTGFVAAEICSTTFLAGQDPERTARAIIAAMPGAGLLAAGLDIAVDRAARRVTVRWLGLAASEARARDGLGCLIDTGPGAVDDTPPAEERLPPPRLPEIAGPAVVAPATPALAAALDAAFAEPGGRVRQTAAVVVVKDGRIIAERYAEGIGIATPLHGWSMTKSVTSALLGILVRQGKLQLDQPAPIAAWRSPGDARGAITIRQLQRHTSGLALGSSLAATAASAFEPVNAMKYVARDRAAFAAAATLATPPGTAWTYSDGNTVLLARIIRDASGGTAAEVLRFARRELFAPLGMRHVTLEVDATGTPEGSSQMFAPARDWARFGLLYLNDGVVGGQRILPPGWVADAATPTPGAFVGIGAGLWTNQGDSEGARKRIAFGMPADAIHARGQFGQYVVIIPSQRMVVVRLGTASSGGDPEGVSQLVAAVIAATRDGS